jgi:glycine/D-amino acid oxidase-like deaminating enzyme
VWVAGGYSGHGNALGLACGDLVGRAILGESLPELEIFDPSRDIATDAAVRQAPGNGS